jgi:hypothetical protein
LANNNSDEVQSITTIIERQNNLSVIPDSLKTIEMCKIACFYNGWNIVHTPLEFKKDIYGIAVKNNGMSILLIPDDILTEELILAACMNTMEAFIYIPDKLKTEKLCIVLAQWSGLLYKYLPLSLQTHDFRLKVVKVNGLAIRHIPKNLRNIDLYVEAYKQNPEVIKEIPYFSRKYISNYITRKTDIKTTNLINFRGI